MRPSPRSRPRKFPNSPAALAARAWLTLMLLGLVFAAVFWAAGAAAQNEGGVIVGAVQDDRGDPIADAKVVITAEGFSSSYLTQADGRFEFRKLTPTRYRITAEAAGFRKETTF